MQSEALLSNKRAWLCFTILWPDSRAELDNATSDEAVKILILLHELAKREHQLLMDFSGDLYALCASIRGH